MEPLPRREREKQIHEEEIILAAEKVFRQKGFENASMDEIAREAQFTKRTLYQYFPGKEELFFAVVARGFQELHRCLWEAVRNETSGYEKICRTGTSCYQYYQTHPDMFRLISSIGHVRQSTAEDGKQRQGFLSINDDLFRGFAALIAEGQADGSIRADLDASQTAYSLVFLLTGFFNQLSVSGKTFSAHFDMDMEKFSLSTLSLLFRTIQTPPTR